MHYVFHEQPPPLLQPKVRILCYATNDRTLLAELGKFLPELG